MSLDLGRLPAATERTSRCCERPFPIVDAVPRVSDGNPVRRISTLLEPAGRVEGLPVRLAENAGMAFIGCYVLGMGFVITPEQAQEWIADDPRNAEVLFPYLNGEDLNSRPDCSASRWVIDFGTMSKDLAAQYVEPFARVEALVQPERARGNIAYRRDSWWKFAAWAPAMRRAIADLSEVLVIALVSKTVMPVRVSASQVFSHALGVFATDDYGDQAVLSSSLHQLWAITYGSTLETRIRYTPSDVFDTLPRPTSLPVLYTLGRTLDSERRDMMMKRDMGLTQLYNLVNDRTVDGDPDVIRLRKIHAEIDAAVVAAFGWEDIELEHGFHSYRQAEKWTISPVARVELLDRLVSANHRRAGYGANS